MSVIRKGFRKLNITFRPAGSKSKKPFQKALYCDGFTIIKQLLERFKGPVYKKVYKGVSFFCKWQSYISLPTN